jgi:hypothetical protein
MLIKVHCAYQLGQEEAELGLSVCLVAIVMLVLAACCCIQDSKQLLLQFCQHEINIACWQYLLHAGNTACWAFVSTAVCIMLTSTSFQIPYVQTVACA